ncbi:MAG TPA: type II toxin-antitoxin system RelE/ParE family toxin [Stellaceae bacterium]|nr:type II toxin-antitoxin system RelE/ParE family toxin [Stellaceae bacterium]
MRRIIWTEPARQDLERIQDYIGQFNPAAARGVAERLLAAADSLGSFAERGRPSGIDRELTAIRPYVLRYRIIGGVVFILRVRHGGTLGSSPTR